MRVKALLQLSNFTKVLALDHFNDALSESEVRLRLREVGPKTLPEAEKIAVRMEAHQIADKQRTRFVGKVEQAPRVTSDCQKSLENQITDIHKKYRLFTKDKAGTSHFTM